MAKLTIRGNTKPIVGNTEAYSLSVFDNVMTSNPFSFPHPKVKWDIYVQDRNGWRIAKGNIKEGENVTYKFTAKSLKYKALRIEVVRGKDKGELYIKPQEAEDPKIVSVELQDINSERLPKGKLLHYTDTVIAKAHCVGMFGYKVAFTLWEDDAIGKGHDPIVNMMNKINQVPLIGEVNHEGVAKVYFRLPAYTMAVQIANAGVARGDKSEGKTHEYYVTAEVVSKHILKASPNVNVANPAHIPAPPKKAEPVDNTPAHRKPPVAPEHNKPKPNKPKPQEETAKFPQTPAAKKQADPEGKILSVEFTDGTGKTLKKAKTGDTVSIKITSQGMRGKNVTIKIWEEDLSRYNDDLLYKESVTLAYDTSFINYIKLTKAMYDKSNDFGEGNEREYYIEVEHLKTSVTSQVIPISPSAEPVKVDPNDSPAIIKEPKQEKIKKEGKCFCNRDFTPDEFEKIIHGLRDSEPTVKKNIGYTLFGASNCKLKQEDKTIEKLRIELNKVFNTYEINTCIRKLHFLAQIYHETDRLKTTLEYDTNKKYKPYFGRGLMQLTWESNYIVYKDYSKIDCVKDYDSIANNFSYACDSAGWFWKQGKVLSVGKRWTGPPNPPTYVKIHKPDYPKKTISYKHGEKTIKYGTVDLGLIADDDKVDLISYLVNGGENGLVERRNYVVTLKSIFNYPQECINKKQIVAVKKEKEDDNEVTLHFVGQTAKENALSDKTKKILKEVGKVSGNYDIYITSTARSSYDQARIMYDNCKTDVNEQKRIYKAPGKKVIAVYEANIKKPKSEVVKLMENKINELGPSTVSKHLANPEVLNTFDVSYDNLSNKTKFWNEMEKRPELDAILNENRCYHIQIKQK
ncbi:hypothetical protein DRF65_00505 [Chryseobacterium pennae]|uniref:Glycoside hydrolase family 19 catalytic domain-containing protein n=1 Tax=Chryseobacterium pennae TaxID=2258962 RepID=A0A3D9CEZ8_9FLAO|nr:hypothetical protein [Chryseobacterium pennae]REC64091.1 hypothetical protein DRF65_00505 [Chryseobacterium pennae]